MNEVSGRVLPVVFAALHARGISPTPLLEGLRFDESVTHNLRQRVDWNDFALFLNRIRAHLPDSGDFVRMGREFVARPEYLRVATVFSLALTPQVLMKLLVGWLGPYQFYNVKSQLRWLGADCAELTLSIDDAFLDCPPFFHINVGAFAEGMRLCSPGPAQVTLELHERRAVYRIEFLTRKPVHERAIALVKSFASHRHLAKQLLEQQSELGETFAALRESERRYRMLLEQSLDGIWRLDLATSRFEFVSNASTSLVGYTPEEMHKLPLESLFSPDDSERVKQHIRDVAKGVADSFVIEVQHIRKDGSVFWGEVHAGVICERSGKRVALQGVTRDVTARKEAETERIRALAAEEAKARLEAEIQERKRVEVELIAAKEQAEASLRLKDSISANLSHEIRTPLTALIGFAQILTMRLKGTEYEPQLQIIQNAGRRLLLLLNNMLDLARLDAGKLHVEPVAYPIAETIRQVAELLGLQAREQGLAIELFLDDELLVLSDRRRDEQILLNVIGNAIRFTEEGSIRVAMAVDGGWGVVRVTDTGIGISEAFLPHVFEEFRQESEGLNRRHDGSGLGLPLSQKLVEALGGEIRIESRKQVGTTVEIRLPLAQAPASMKPELLTSHPEVSLFKRVRLLVVEDDADTMAYLGDALEGCAEIIPADSADAALDCLAVAPDLHGILLDINLKGSRIDGTALLAAIRKLPRYANLPVTAMTAHALPGDKERVLAEGFDGYLAKPVGVDELQKWAARLGAQAAGFESISLD
jgi:PAS domain S-box-containing protein